MWSWDYLTAARRPLARPVDRLVRPDGQIVHLPAPEVSTDPRSWRPWAACADQDTDLFFPAAGASRSARRAREVCGSCPVQRQCLAYALEADVRHGIWGGTTGEERRRIRRDRRREGVAA